MEIHVAKSAGFCFGVKRAVRLALETAKNQTGPIYMLGDIVHNEHVVRELDQAGIRVVNSLDHISAGTLIIRAHGEIPETYRIAQQKGLTMIDATCPLVLEIHAYTRQLQAEGYTVVVIGDHGHDEVIGIAGQVESAIILSNPEEAEKVFQGANRIGVVVQSTQNIENVQSILSVLAAKCRELKFFHTICGPTIQHQRDIRQLPKEHDVMLIIGSRTSANTCRLTAISNMLNSRTYQVETADDVQPEWFQGVSSVGVSAGASTPDIIIQDVIARIQEIAEKKYYT
ncbi:4-hydroxy-3-methylbut-2-enyl diphosphate reductase [Candidatus Vecturithrix granuli]|uniref:4-hydroxy-3-methylbut-2-enyl diphosphate reductase n=1 Tax=Vecturithrix granuli TaxID=1499967 RepID=A0A081C820_VECG1|nr:4-hydroxy-3-methylbut-2-enyl diphosphate reductase [Candidatus Vecturithrix granuli]